MSLQNKHILSKKLAIKYTSLPVFTFHPDEGKNLKKRITIFIQSCISLQPHHAVPHRVIYGSNCETTDLYQIGQKEHFDCQNDDCRPQYYEYSCGQQQFFVIGSTVLKKKKKCIQDRYQLGVNV